MKELDFDNYYDLFDIYPSLPLILVGSCHSIEAGTYVNWFVQVVTPVGCVVVVGRSD